MVQPAQLSGPLICKCCQQARDIYDLVLCTVERPIDKPHPYYCKSHCIEESCGHARDCVQTLHETCWDAHIPPRLRKNSDHNQVDALQDAFIQIIMHSEANDEKQKLLHRQDRKAEWFRVNLARPDVANDLPLLQISARFRKECKANQDRTSHDHSLFPSLVSFVGDTGAGKSTLVNAMITIGRIEDLKRKHAMKSINSFRLPKSSLENILSARSYGPVTRSGNVERASMPTSTGVHLYRDPTITQVDYPGSANGAEDVPMLFADCEGFRGGSVQTSAERSEEAYSRSSMLAPVSRPRSNSTTSMTSASSQNQPRGGMDPEFCVDEVVIKAPDFKAAGKTSAELFYARFLYAFSDVVVFVTREDQKLNSDMQRLLEWAASAVEKSMGRRSQKTLIVVRNGPQLHDKVLYEDGRRQDSIFKSVTGRIWEHSEELTAIKEKHEKLDWMQDEIHDNEAFFKIFFQETMTCYIPRSDKAPPDEIYGQYQQLRGLIETGSKASQRVRRTDWTRYDVSTMSHLLTRAFYHFAISNKPFNFYSATRMDNPTPVSVSGHIANLLRHMRTSESKLTSFSEVVAACLISFVYREWKATEPLEIFENDLKAYCIRGIELYQSDYQQCAFFLSDSGRCVYFKRHHPEHCSESGTKHRGKFDGSEYDGDTTATVNGIKRHFIDGYKKLYSTKDRDTVLRAPASSDVAAFRKGVLGSYTLRRTTTNIPDDPKASLSFWDRAKSNSTCFACLQSAPDHVMPCGHGFCDQCIKDFGTVDSSCRYRYIFDQCVMCLQSFGNGTKAPFGAKQLIRLVPTCAGIRILTLDGGGIRGIVELAILEKLHSRVGLNVSVRDLFDLVIGTSTGGIIALGLSMTELSVLQMKEKFLELAQKVFREDRRGVLSKADVLDLMPKLLMLMKVWKSRYPSHNLKEGLIKLFDENTSIFSSSTVTGRQRAVRVAVTATSSGYPCIFTNYSRAKYKRETQEDNDLRSAKGFEREGDPDKEARIWQAAMATSAAPGYFQKMIIGTSAKLAKPYTDGALRLNLPAKYALEEKDRIWPPDKEHRPLDTLVSVGTGVQVDEFNLPGWLDVASVGELAKAYYDNVIDTRAVWEEFTKSSTYDPALHRRLNVPLPKNIDLDDWTSMTRLITLVDNTYSQNCTPGSLAWELEKVAYRLTASLLFFEPDAPGNLSSNYGQWSMHYPQEISGHIWCRLEQGSDPFNALLHRIDSFWLREGTDPWTPIALQPGWRSRVQGQGRAFAIRCKISTRYPDKVQNLAVKLQPPHATPNARWSPILPLDERTPISGFPITFNQLKQMAGSGGTAAAMA